MGQGRCANLRAWCAARRRPRRRALLGGGCDDPTQSRRRRALEDAPAPFAGCTTRRTSSRRRRRGVQGAWRTRGNPVVVNKWASWCGAVPRGVPLLPRIRRASARRWPSSASTRTTTTATRATSSRSTRCRTSLQGPVARDRRGLQRRAGVPDDRLLRLEGRARVREAGRLPVRGRAGGGHRALRALTSGRTAAHRARRRSQALALREHVFCGEQGVSSSPPTATGSTTRRSTSSRSRTGACDRHLPRARSRRRRRGWAGWRSSPSGAARASRAAMLAAAERVARDAGARLIALHAQTYVAAVPRRRLRGARAGRSSRRASSTWRWSKHA